MKCLMKILSMIFILSVYSYATQETLIEIAQPIYTENGIAESITTYVLYINWTGDAKVYLTFEENRIKDDIGFKNRNLANIFGLNAKIIYDPEFSLANLERLKIRITISDSVNVDERYKGIELEEVIEATIKCLKKNLSSISKIKSIELIFDPESAYAKFSKVHTIRD